MKKAVCVGVSYHTNPMVRTLTKAHEDAENIGDLLINTFEYDDVTLLLDRHGYTYPTRDNIVQALYDLVDSATAGDRLVFHYSGHGSQIPNTDGKESDGLDEVIWPLDVDFGERDDDEQYNVIIDNEIHEILIDDLPPGVHLTIIFDCCHSGTAADLPEHPKTKDKKFNTRRHFKVRRQVVSDEEPRVVAWSACQDPQEAYQHDEFGGLLVALLCRKLQNGPEDVSYGSLLEEIRGTISAIYEQHGLGDPQDPDISVLGDYYEALNDVVEF